MLNTLSALLSCHLEHALLDLRKKTKSCAKKIYMGSLARNLLSFLMPIPMFGGDSKQGSETEDSIYNTLHGTMIHFRNKGT